MSWLERCFSELPDPRTGNATRHDLIEVVTIALVASVCGAESCVDFADFARDRGALFRDFLKLENGLPSHDTFSRLFRLLDPAASGTCFARFLDGLGEDGQGVVAIDGKTGPHRGEPRCWCGRPRGLGCQGWGVEEPTKEPSDGTEADRDGHVKVRVHAARDRCRGPGGAAAGVAAAAG